MCFNNLNYGKIVIFDLSGTIFGAIDGSLRPGVKNLVDGLRAAGHTVYFWTAGEVFYYMELLHKAGLDGSVFSKREKLPFSPDVYIDDDPSPSFIHKTIIVEPYYRAGDSSIPQELLKEKLKEVN